MTVLHRFYCFCYCNGKSPRSMAISQKNGERFLVSFNPDILNSRFNVHTPATPPQVSKIRGHIVFVCAYSKLLTLVNASTLTPPSPPIGGPAIWWCQHLYPAWSQFCHLLSHLFMFSSVLSSVHVAYIANIMDPDQTALWSSLIRVHIVCFH